jgi:pentatricopeptide repeat domain-containing protein 1
MGTLTAIWTAAQAGDCRSALEIFREMKASNSTTSIVPYNGVLTALSADGQAELAVSIFRELKQNHPNVLPDHTTFSQLAGSIRKVAVEEEQIALLWRVYALMGPLERRAHVGGRLLEALILAYGGLGHFEEAMSVFESIKGPCNAECLRAILFACSFAEPPEWETALALLHASDIVEGGEGPALVEPGALCNAMLACSKADQWHESLQLFRLYGGKTLSNAAVNSLIASCGRGGRPDMAIRVLFDMEERGLLPDTRSYRNAIIACNQAEHVHRRSLLRNSSDGQEHISVEDFQWWRQAYELLGKMKQHGLVPDTPTLSSAISACEAAGQWQVALEVLQCAMDEEADEQGARRQRLNLYCFNAALAACEKGGAWVEAVEIYEKMKEQGGMDLRPNIVTTSSLVQALDSAGQKELAVSIYDEGLGLEFFKNPWRFAVESSTGVQMNAIDLHSFSAAMSRAAVRSHMESLLSAGLSSPLLNEDLTIIVGKGLRSENLPVLKRAMKNLLQAEFGIDAIVDDRNSGRLVIPLEDLRFFVGSRSWR